MPTTLPACMEYGLGPDQFDCSGLVLRAMQDVLGNDIPPELRHTRQMWHDAQTEQKLFVPAEEKPGALAVYRRRWDTPEGVKMVPAHIAILAEIGPPLTTIVHAQALHNTTQEIPFRSQDSILGFIGLKYL